MMILSIHQRRWALTGLVALLLGVTGCKGDEPAAGGGPTPPGDPAAGGGGGGGEVAFRVVVEATFEVLPEGAIIVAASPRDRTFQKVTRTGHEGAPGVVRGTADGENLFYVSEPVSGAITYRGEFEAARRQAATKGTIEGLEDTRFAAGEGAVGAAPGAEVVAAAAAIGVKEAAPARAVIAIVDHVRAFAKAEDGPDDPAAVLGAERGSPLGIARTVAALARAAGVPARVQHGLRQPGLAGETTSAHAWVEVELPGLGWAPIDVALMDGAGPEAAEPYFGRLPVDRLTMVAGAEAITLPGVGDAPALELSGALGVPFALHAGQRLAPTRWSARFERLGD